MSSLYKFNIHSDKEKGKSRRLTFDGIPSFSTFTQRVGKLFGSQGQDINITYKHKDGTEIPVKSRAELDAAIRHSGADKSSWRPINLDVREAPKSAHVPEASRNESLPPGYQEVDYPPIENQAGVGAAYGRRQGGDPPHVFTYSSDLPVPPVGSYGVLSGNDFFVPTFPVPEPIVLPTTEQYQPRSEAHISSVEEEEENQAQQRQYPGRQGVEPDRVQTIMTASVTEEDFNGRIPYKEKGKGKAVVQSPDVVEEVSEISLMGGDTGRKHTVHVPDHAHYDAPVALTSHPVNPLDIMPPPDHRSSSVTPKGKHNQQTDEESHETLDVGFVETANRLAGVLESLTLLLKDKMLATALNELWTTLADLDTKRTVKIRREDFDGKRRKDMHEEEVEEAQQILTKAAVGLMRQVKDAIGGDFEVPVGQGVRYRPSSGRFPLALSTQLASLLAAEKHDTGMTRPATRAATRAPMREDPLPPAPEPILVGLDSKARLEAAKNLYKREKERYREEREQKKKSRMAKIVASQAAQLPKPHEIAFAGHDRHDSKPMSLSEFYPTDKRPRTTYHVVGEPDSPRTAHHKELAREALAQDADIIGSIHPTSPPAEYKARHPYQHHKSNNPSGGHGEHSARPKRDSAKFVRHNADESGFVSFAMPAGASGRGEEPFIPGFVTRERNPAAADYHKRQRSKSQQLALEELEQERRERGLEGRLDLDDIPREDLELDPEPPTPQTPPIVPNQQHPWVFPDDVDDRAVRSRSAALADAVEEALRADPVPKIYQKVERYGEGMGTGLTRVTASGPYPEPTQGPRSWEDVDDDLGNMESVQAQEVQVVPQPRLQRKVTRDGRRF